jgi:hypothetical protein
VLLHAEPIPEQDDEEIAFVRAARQKISERFGHDPYRLVAYYMERKQQHLDRLVHAPEPEATGDDGIWVEQDD